MKKRVGTWILLCALASAVMLLATDQPEQAPAPGRIAIVADGNNNDSDDICATPVSLAVLKAMALDDKLVHFSHSCDLSKSHAFREKQHQVSCEKTAALWRMKDRTFFNCQTQRAETVADLCEAINASSAGNELWIIESGEPDIIYEAVLAAEPAKRSLVKIVTHHPHNDVGLNHDLTDILALGATKVSIPNQNKHLKSDLADWHWARDSSDPRLQFLWERGELAEKDPKYSGIRGSFDCSDAGMIYFWATGADNGGNEAVTADELKKLLTKHVAEHPLTRVLND